MFTQLEKTDGVNFRLESKISNQVQRMINVVLNQNKNMLKFENRFNLTILDTK